MEYDNDRPVKHVYKIEIIYWIFIFLLYPLINFISIFYKDIKFLPVLLLIGLLIFPFYLIYAKAIVPAFLFTKKYIVFSAISILFFFIILGFLKFIYSFFHLNNSSTALLQSFQFYFNFSGATIFRESLWCITNTIMCVSIAFLTKKFNESNAIAMLEKANANLKLKYLRSQLNPHFLFNTLNSIYSLCLQKSDQAPEVVVRLSDIMRYMIYECDHEKIELDKEIEFIKNYIEIEKIRYKADVQFNVEGETSGIMIEPFLFISFIENGFKHAFDNTYNDAFVYITIKVTSHQIILNVINSTNIDLETQAKKFPGVGIRNSKTLLELIYRDAYALDIIQTDKEEYRKSELRIKNAEKRLKTLYPDSHTLDVILSKNAYTVSLIIKNNFA